MRKRLNSEKERLRNVRTKSKTITLRESLSLTNPFRRKKKPEKAPSIQEIFEANTRLEYDRRVLYHDYLAAAMALERKRNPKE